MQVQETYVINVPKSGRKFTVPFGKFTPTVQAHLLEYGIRQLINDSASSVSVKDLEGEALAKAQAEAGAMVEKRLDALIKGDIRMASERTSDPVEKRAVELAQNAVRGSAKFKAFLAEGKLKAFDKDAAVKCREWAKKLLEPEDNRWVVQARIDVEAAQALSEDIDLDAELGEDEGA